MDIGQTRRSKNVTREPCFSKLGQSSGWDVREQYRMSLEQRIAQGDMDLVCGDEDLLQQVEGRLKEGDPRGALISPGLNLLAVMEESLRAPPPWSRPVGGLTEPARAPGLGTVAKAFEVLERAALNLYLYPWRKEYRVVKIFSGIFTHLVRPALSEQQAMRLFELLGYQWKGAELKLEAPPLSAGTLLRLAYTFFVARCESRLLSAAAAARSDGGPGAELTLVRERQKGRSLQEALESLRRTAGEPEWGYRDEGEMDLYTDGGEGFGAETEAESAGTEKLSTATAYGESVGLRPAGGSSSSISAPNQRVHITLKTQQSATKSLGLDMPASSQTAGDGEMATSSWQNQTCTCFYTPALDLFYCQQCNNIHNSHCKIRDSCKRNKHNLEHIGRDSSSKNQYSPQISGDTALPGSTEGGAAAEQRKEPGVGKATAAALDRPKEGGASTAAEKTREGGASRINSLPLGADCDRQTCTELSFAFCRSCGHKLCEKHWTDIGSFACRCGDILMIRTTSSV